MTGTDFFDPNHLGWAFILGPATIVAAAINLDNRYLGPYFALVDVVLNDFGTGYRWHDREILLSLVRRVGYIVVMGFLLNLFQYQLRDIAAVFFVAGFLLLWPAFARPLPVPGRKSDRLVLLVWASYWISVVLFGLFGARLWALIRAVSGQEPWEFIRSNLAWTFFWGLAALVVTGFRARLQGRFWQRARDGYDGGGPEETRDTQV
ncbi:hypothetical protein [Mycobacterium sp. C31M]